jgi:hypothetical protein
VGRTGIALAQGKDWSTSVNCQCRSFLRVLALQCVFCLASQIPASAEVFESRFLRFSLPEGWKCDLEGSEFVCEPAHPKGHKVSMIIILAAKYQGDFDTFPNYMEYLRKNKSVTGRSSLVEGPKINNEIGSVSWVEATHYESELKGFYTTYLATVTEGLAVLVTFSASKDKYPQFRDMIRPCIQSLEIKKDWRPKPSDPKDQR